MKLNLDKQFLNLKGEPLPDKLDEVLANMLAMSTTGPPAKMITWAVNLTNNGEIEVDKADIKFLTKFIEQHPATTNLAKDQLLDEIEKLENAQPNKTESCHCDADGVIKDVERKLSNMI